MRILVILALALVSSASLADTFSVNERPFAQVVEQNGVLVGVEMLNRKGEVTHRIPLQQISGPTIVAETPPSPKATPKPKLVQRASLAPRSSSPPMPRLTMAERIYISLERLSALSVVEP